MGSAERKPSLEAPSLGFRRRKRESPSDRVEAPAPEQAAVEQAAVEPVTAGPAVVSATAEVQGVPRQPRRPLNGHLAAAVTGVVVGAFLVVATLGGLQACQSIRGTTSCGGGPGSLLLLLIVVVAVVVGAAVLRSAGISSAGSISFLAVALVSVISVLFLLDTLDRPGGGVAVGLVTVGSYLLSHWVTVRYIDAVE
jgi:hypothetical protein